MASHERAPKGAGASPLGLEVDGTRKLRIDRLDPTDTAGWDKTAAADRLAALGEEFAELGNLLAYAADHAMLIVFQGRDASGKDGAIRKVLDYSNIQSAQVHAFKAPSEEERAHDFLWRVHRVCPGRGQLALFNRSHYEDVIAARVKKLVPERVWRARYDRINAFEELLADNDTIVLKFFLDVSRDEQIERLLAREEDPRTAWKLNPGDWNELPLWDEVTRAYEDVLVRCATPERPWIVVPADRKWFRNLVIMDRIVRALRPYKDGWLASLARRGRSARQEIEAIRGRIGVRQASSRKRARHSGRGNAHAVTRPNKR
jgi:PPK2 family polyphosphate:nucleotide phosphotransferase